MDILELGKNPISESSRGGDDPRYVPEYEQMQAEVAKLSSPTSSGNMNWQNLRELCEKILAEKAKDSLASAYLTMALLQTAGLDGFMQGIAMMRALYENFWEDMHPPLKRVRGRKNAIEWLYTQAEEYFKAKEQKPVPEEKLEAMLENFGALNNLLSEKMEDPPYWRALDEALRSIPAQVKEAPKPAAPAAQPAGQAAPPSAPASRPAAAAPEIPEQLGSVQDAEKTIQAGFKVLRQAGNFYLENDPSHPAPYLFNRLSAWMGIPGLPPNTDKVTRIPAPPEQVRNILANLAQNGEWENLLKAAETKVTQFLFWLDLSRMTYNALDRMGPKFGTAKETVAQQTANFVKRIKGIEGFMFADETPFADVETRAWLDEISKAGEGGGGGKSQGDGDPELARVAELFDQARGMAKEDLPGAAGLLAENLARAGSASHRLAWRMALTKLLLQARKLAAARPHVERILEDVRQYGLEDWDPETALEAYKTVLPAVKGQKDEKSLALAAEIMSSIARIDPGEAIRLE